ncbi:hypothetical protein CANCADRAFT_15638, partial [Tortispora caseinolytica NRRL Y-17796]
LMLANTSSTARDHLANERTFLAWLRTSMAFASIGVAVIQLFLIVGEDRPLIARSGAPLGSCLVAVGTLVLLIGSYRYFECQNRLLDGVFPAARGPVLFVTLASLSAIIAALILTL